MTVSVQALSDVIVFTKYARFDENLGRRETYPEIVERNKRMHKRKFKGNTEILNKLDYYYDNFVLTKKMLPSMRSMQFAGKPIEVNPTRIFNCAFAPADHYKIFSETMFLLLGGTGMGYSVQYHHVEKLPAVVPPVRKRRYLIGDSIEGWADSVKLLVESYLRGKSLPVFDFSNIREKGEPLTSGGRAPGPQPLKDCLHNLKKILDTKKAGEKLKPIEVHDMLCHIADAILVGGIRKAALIALFSMDDYEMLTSKFGNWWELNPQRGRANNSAVVVRHRVKKSDFDEMWEKIKASGSGEPAFVFTNNPDWGCNPCVEIGMRPNQFCNLVEINGNDVKDQKDANERVEAGATIATIQASYTNFHYLRDVWQKTTEKDALIGVSWTGIASGALDHINLVECAEVVKKTNKIVAKLIGINPAARTTCVKPAGTTSLVLGSASGIHGWHAPLYIRRIRVGKDEKLYQYLAKELPGLVEDEFFNPREQAVVSFPIKAPKGARFRTEPSLELLTRVKRFNEEWVAPGHTTGDNGHNVSATISVREDEWDEVGEWMWDNRSSYNGLAVLPHDGGTYKQAPFEEIDQKTYNEMIQHINRLDLTKVNEATDNTDLSGEVACAGGQCSI